MTTTFSYLTQRPSQSDNHPLYLDHTDLIQAIENNTCKHKCVRITRPSYIAPTYLPNLLTLYYDKSQKKNFETNFKNTIINTIKPKKHNKYNVLTVDLSNLDLSDYHCTNTIIERLLSSIKTFIKNSDLANHSAAPKNSIQSLLKKLQKQDTEHDIIYYFLDFIHRYTKMKLVVYIDEGTSLNVDSIDSIRPTDIFYRVLSNQKCIYKIITSDIKSNHPNIINNTSYAPKNITQLPEVQRIFKFNENEVHQLIQQYHLADSEQAIDHIKTNIIKFLKDITKGYSNHYFNPKATLFYLDHVALFKKPPEQFNEKLVNKSVFSKPAFSYADPETLKPILFALLKNKTLSSIGQVGLYNDVSMGEMSTNSVLGHLYKDKLIVHPANHRYRLMPTDEEAAQQLLLLYSAL